MTTSGHEAPGREALQDAMVRAVAAGDTHRAVQALAHLVVVMVDSEAALVNRMKSIEKRLDELEGS